MSFFAIIIPVLNLKCTKWDINSVFHGKHQCGAFFLLKYQYSLSIMLGFFHHTIPGMYRACVRGPICEEIKDCMIHHPSFIIEKEKKRDRAFFLLPSLYSNYVALLLCWMGPTGDSPRTSTLWILWCVPNNARNLLKFTNIYHVMQGLVIICDA